MFLRRRRRSVHPLRSCVGVILVGPGISSYAAAPRRAGESLRACLREAEQHVPQKRHQETSLYLGATAGMRLLRSDTLAGPVQRPATT